MSEYSIAALSARAQGDGDVPWNPSGVLYRDGTTRPSWDVHLRSAKPIRVAQAR